MISPANVRTLAEAFWIKRDVFNLFLSLICYMLERTYTLNKIPTNAELFSV